MAVSAVKVLPRWNDEPLPKTFGMRKNSYATRLRAAITPMMLIFCTVNFVLVKAATSRDSATTTNSSSHMVDVDIIFMLLHFFAAKRLTNTSLQGMLLL